MEYHILTAESLDPEVLKVLGEGKLTFDMIRCNLYLLNVCLERGISLIFLANPR